MEYNRGRGSRQCTNKIRRINMEVKINKIKEIFSELLPILEKYNTGEINYQINEIRKGEELIRLNDYSEELLSELKIIIKTLYPPHGGLSDFYIWKEDEGERIEVNKPIATLGDLLWELAK
jgi:hypothetical protein